LIVSSGVCAEERAFPPSDRSGGEGQWQVFDLDMSPEQYEDASQDNLRLIRNVAENYSRRMLGSIGVPEAGVDFMGAAIGLAVSDTKFHLNKSNTMLLQLDDVVDQDRAVYFKYEINW
jgi:hypothetical protein